MRLEKILALTLITLSLGGNSVVAENTIPTPINNEPQPVHKPVVRSLNTNAPYKNQVSISVRGADRIIQSNGVPSTQSRAIPNSGKRHKIQPQAYRIAPPTVPTMREAPLPANGKIFGFALDGVPFKTSPETFFKNPNDRKWKFSPLSAEETQNLDVNTGHVSKDGAYYYVGVPRKLLRKRGLRPSAHSPLIGWSLDGFPIYALYGYATPSNHRSGLKYLRSSYRLKKGNRPALFSGPGGAHDGTLARDFEFVANRGDLDECNGRFTVTPEFPRGTYAYFLTDDWPTIPRCFKAPPAPLLSAGDLAAKQATGSLRTAPLTVKITVDKKNNDKESFAKRWFRIPFSTSSDKNDKP